MAIISERLAQAVHGAHYCHYDEERNTLIVWHGGHTFNVYDLHTGHAIAMWTADNQLGLNDRQWADMAWRLQAAEDNIRRKLSEEFAQENDGMDYLEAYSA